MPTFDESVNAAANGIKPVTDRGFLIASEIQGDYLSYCMLHFANTVRGKFRRKLYFFAGFFILRGNFGFKPVGTVQAFVIERDSHEVVRPIAYLGITPFNLSHNFNCIDTKCRAGYRAIVARACSTVKSRLVHPRSCFAAKQSLITMAK